MKTTLSICIVLYNPHFGELEKTLTSLEHSLNESQLCNTIHIVDNSSSSATIGAWLASTFPGRQFVVYSGHGNIGFGRANNLCLNSIGEYHLVLNPDVELAADSLKVALSFMASHSECGLLAPLVYGNNGSRQYLCKRFPSVLDLALRGFAPRNLKKVFQKRLDRYEMVDMPETAVFWDPPIVSGCFMLFRGDVFKTLNGFAPEYFLYFEDYDLSLRTGQISRIAFVPNVRINHGGGYASSKGAWHIWQFVKSGLTFYRKFGLKLW